jgi:hypothetical protein
MRSNSSGTPLSPAEQTRRRRSRRRGERPAQNQRRAWQRRARASQRRLLALLSTLAVAGELVAVEDVRLTYDLARAQVAVSGGRLTELDQLATTHRRREARGSNGAHRPGEHHRRGSGRRAPGAGAPSSLPNGDRGDRGAHAANHARPDHCCLLRSRRCRGDRGATKPAFWGGAWCRGGRSTRAPLAVTGYGIGTGWNWPIGSSPDEGGTPVEFIPSDARRLEG